MRKALVIVLLLICTTMVAAEIDYPLSDSYSKNVFREQQRNRFLYPENWESKSFIEGGAFVRSAPRNVVVKNDVSQVKPIHQRAEIYSGSTNVPASTKRRSIFDYDLERDRRGFFQENNYITNYERRVRTEPYREYRHVPADANIMRLIRPPKKQGSPTATGEVTVTVVPETSS